MNTHAPKPDPALSWLREAHRAQRAPLASRRRAFATVKQAADRAREAEAATAATRSRPRATTGWLLAVGAAAIAAVLWTTRPDSQSPVDLSSEPVRKRLASAADCTRPLPGGTYNPGRSDTFNRYKGIETRVLSMPTPCGPLLRRYLVRVPKGNVEAPSILIVAHDRDENAEQAQISTRWWFEDLAERTQAVLVMVQGTETSRTKADPTTDWRETTRWQTDEGVHPAVDDFAYLQEVVRDVRSEHALENSDVVLAGYGSGAVFSLAAAARFPDQYAGVAAFLPTRPLKGADLASKADHPASTAASRTIPAPPVFIVVREPVESLPEAHEGLKRWTKPFGTLKLWIGPSLPPHQRLGGGWPTGIQQLDGVAGPSTAAVRVLLLSPEVDPFPLPGGSDPITRSASEERDTFFHGPLAAWNFLRWQGHNPGVSR